MTYQDMERAAVDRSISNKKYFEMLLKFFDEGDELGKSETVKKNRGIYSTPEFIKWEADMDHFREHLKNHRKFVWFKLGLHVIRQHLGCCGPFHRH